MNVGREDAFQLAWPAKWSVMESQPSHKYMWLYFTLYWQKEYLQEKSKRSVIIQRAMSWTFTTAGSFH
ncbi:hypothetical protein A2U01_0013601 [Trifolium medium]|uniref:Uncharacterized protein n=1 Tax=Trifolium medium TaxID=97028 RepID=A0A392MYQ6_9FABA|nr:hypothetical protein [Trifolium medium]